MDQAVDRIPVLLVGNFLSSKLGSRTVCEDLAVQLKNAGWPIITVSDKLDRLARLVDMLNTVWRRRHDYSVAQVDVYGTPMAFRWAEAACQALRLARKPYILTLHGGSTPEFARQHPGRVRQLLRSAALVTTPSRYLFEQMTAYRTDLCLQPNPLNLAAYVFRLRTHAAPRLVWLRAFHHGYNPSLGPRAVALLARRFPSVSLIMVGPDKGDGSLETTQQMATSLGLGDRITFVGKVPKSAVPEWLNKGDIFLNTTNIDNAPISILEAMASGLCVVSTNVGGIPYILDHERDALLVPPDDPAAIACAVENILTSPELATRLSLNARTKVEQFDWSIILPKWEGLLRSVALKNS